MCPGCEHGLPCAKDGGFGLFQGAHACVAAPWAPTRGLTLVATQVVNTVKHIQTQLCVRNTLAVPPGCEPMGWVTPVWCVSGLCLASLHQDAAITQLMLLGGALQTVIATLQAMWQPGCSLWLVPKGQPHVCMCVWLLACPSGMGLLPCGAAAVAAAM